MELIGESTLALAGSLRTGADSTRAHAIFFSGDIPETIDDIPFDVNDPLALTTQPNIVAGGRMLMAFDHVGKHTRITATQEAYRAQSWGINNVGPYGGVYVNRPDRCYLRCMYSAYSPPSNWIGLPFADSTIDEYANLRPNNTEFGQTHPMQVLRAAFAAMESMGSYAGQPVGLYARSTANNQPACIVHEYDTPQTLNRLWGQIANFSGTLAMANIYVRVLYLDSNGVFQNALTRTQFGTAFATPYVKTFTQATSKAWAIVIDGNTANGQVFGSFVLGHSTNTANAARTWTRGNATWGLLMPDLKLSGSKPIERIGNKLPVTLVKSGENFTPTALAWYGPVGLPTTTIRLRHR